MTKTEIERFKQSIDILKVIQDEGFDPRKNGSGWKLLCPFHDDKNPSLSIDDKKQLFHCFGCGKSGDVIKFIEYYYNYNFKQALDYLSRKYSTIKTPPPPVMNGIHNLKGKNLNAVQADVNACPASYPKDRCRDIHTQNLKTTPLRVREQEANQRVKHLNKVTEIYHQTLLKNEKALLYLKKRGITNYELIRKFKIGFCDGSLINRLAKKSGEYNILKQAGIIKENTRGNPYEHFKGYITFPFFDEHKNTGEIYGRLLDE